MGLISRGRIAAVGVAVAVAGGGVVVVASGSAENSPAPARAATYEGVALIAPEAPRDALAPQTEAAIRDGAAEAGASPVLREVATSESRTASRVVPTAAGDVSVVASAGGVCVAADRFGLSCGPGPGRTKFVGGSTVGEGGKSVVLFLVNDDVREARVALRGGDVEVVPAKRNVVAAVVDAEPTGYAFVNGEGSLVAGTSVGPDEAPR